MPLAVVILAAGQGTRMRSRLPKVLHEMAGRPLLKHVLDTAAQLEPDDVHVVIGHGGDQVRDALADSEVHWHEQTERLGTGHAVAQALPAIGDDAQVLVLYGDVPLLRAQTLRDLVAAGAADSLRLLTVDMQQPRGYGRIVRDADGHVVQIVEEKDATAEQRLLTEANTGVLVCPAARLRDWIARVKNDNAQGEYYLTDVVELAVRDRVDVQALVARGEDEALGINNKAHLAEAEAIHRARIAAELMAAGVTLADPQRIDVRGTLVCGQDVFIDANVLFLGDVQLGDDVRIGPNVVIRDSQVQDGTVIHPNCVIEEAHFGPQCQIGPFARVRPESYFGSSVKLGNFVEIKKSNIAKGSKVNHLSYIGDTTMGEKVNVGAGTITCNYDGANKHRTTIGADVFIGSGTQIIAPVTLEDGATIGAGSVITRTAPAGKLTLERGKQTTLDHWKRPRKS